MAKRKYGFDEQKIARFEREGRGQGHGASYRPWLTIQDVPSQGRSTRVHSFKTGREHHFLSDLETGLFFLLDWSDQVTDIREQFPLDREQTRQLARDMGIAHPKDPTTQVDIVMTTDFLVEMRGSKEASLTARAVKPADELDKPRIIEKLELERRYWLAQGVAWHVVTDRELPKQRIMTLKWLHEMRSLEYQSTPYPGYWEDRCDRFIEQLRRTRGGSIRHFLAHLEEGLGFAPGDGMTVLRHLAARQIVVIDLDRAFSTNDPLDRLALSTDTNRVIRRASSC